MTLNKNDKHYAITEPTLRRLPLYYDVLDELLSDEIVNVSCTTIANELSLIPIQVRKDLQQAGAIGKPKIGYDIKELMEILEQALGYNNTSDAFIIGLGNLGHALLGFDGFNDCGMNIVAAFDTDENKIDNEYFGKKVFHLNKLPELAKRMHINIGIITTPKSHAQEVADILVESGITAIWNFTSTNLHLPENIIVQNENLAISLSLLLNKLHVSKETNNI